MLDPHPAADPSSSPPATATAGAAPAQGEPAPWWCFSFGNGEVGACQRARLKCEAARGQLVATRTDPNERLSECAPQQEVVCFDTQKASGGAVETLCHPTFAICRSHIAYIRSSSAGSVRVVSDCRSTSPEPRAASNASPDRPETAHWWCHTAGNGKVGLCDRSRGMCEDSRARALRIWSNDPGQVSDCSPQQSAICFETEDVHGGKRHLHCRPTASTCQGFADDFAPQNAQNERVVSDCHPVD